MFKKILWVSTVITLLAITGCGSSNKSSEEGKALMNKLLNFVGIPTDIIVAVCIDKDKNGICASSEIQAKVTLNKGDSFDDVWEKLALTNEGKYLLEVYDETLPILITIQDEAKVDFDNGKFTLNFDGFNTKEQNETKEISILQSMVDSDSISNTVANKFRTLTNKDSQNKFYVTLLNDLESNINTLRAKGLDSKKAVSATVKEMADETKTNQEQADKINACGNDQACVEREIKSLSDELIITDEESNVIVSSNNSNSENNNPQQIGKWVTPSKSVCESNGGDGHSYEENQCLSYWKNAEKICTKSSARLPTINELRAVVTNCGGIIDDFQNTNNTAYTTCYRKEGFADLLTYLSSSNSLNDNDSVMSISFTYGFEYTEKKVDELGYVRCVKN